MFLLQIRMIRQTSYLQLSIFTTEKSFHFFFHEKVFLLSLSFCKAFSFASHKNMIFLCFDNEKLKAENYKKRFFSLISAKEIIFNSKKVFSCLEMIQCLENFLRNYTHKPILISFLVI